MEITLTGLAKRFGGQWLFRNLHQHFQSPGAWAITGPNGSGKTTLLHIISGMIPATEGQVEYKLNDRVIDPDYLYRHLWLVAPYMELLEELTLKELFRFHFQLKPQSGELDVEEMASSCQLEAALNKPLGKFSSGMKQRAKLAMGFFSEVPLLLLDEPSTNLDKSGFNWYYHQMSKLAEEKLVIICSNQPKEYEFCHQTLELSNANG